ncbi:MAG: hypothetical protein CR975_07005 [Gammaproteobacteria bacterium]|nr:MAG: hypothetical protein CR975_07005 [Gammaproteobacteria bacterium]
MQLIPHETDSNKKIRFEIVILSKELRAIENELAEFHRQLYAFDREYQQRLGDLAEAVLSLRLELGINQQPQYGEAAPVLTHLAEKEYQLLKTAYRQAAKLCHPDYLADHHQKVGLQLFDTLNKAYHLQDLVTVEHILWLLQSGQAFSQTTVILSDQTLLKKRKELLCYLIAQKKDQLAQLQMREEYDVSNRDNWNILLYDYQTRLEDELAILRGRVAAIKKNKEN